VWLKEARKDSGKALTPKKKRMKKNKNGWKKLDEKINRMKKEMVSNLS
jgi:hypothetical protein